MEREGGQTKPNRGRVMGGKMGQGKGRKHNKKERKRKERKCKAREGGETKRNRAVGGDGR